MLRMKMFQEASLSLRQIICVAYVPEHSNFLLVKSNAAKHPLQPDVLTRLENVQMSLTIHKPTHLNNNSDNHLGTDWLLCLMAYQPL